NGELGFLALLGSSGNRVLVLGPNLATYPLEIEAIRALLCDSLEEPLRAPTEKLLEFAAVPAQRRCKAFGAILAQQLAAERVCGCWLIRLPPSASLWHLVREARIPGKLLGLLGAHAAQYVLWLLSWWLIGQVALQGRFDWGWLIAWSLVLFSTIPF